MSTITRWLLTVGFTLSLTMGIFLIESKAASQQMINDAKREGKVTYYGAISAPEAFKLSQVFEKKYPGIRVENVRLNLQKMMQRVLTEGRAGHTVADVISINDVSMTLFRMDGFLGKFDNPEAAAYKPGFKDPDGYFTGLYGNTTVMVYNTRMVKPQEAPKSYEDLLDPKWKGKIGMDGTKWEWFAAQLQNMGRDKGFAYMKKLAAQNLQFRGGLTLLTQLCAAGEFPIVAYVYASSVEKLIADGAPIEWVPSQPIFMVLASVGITAKPPHPNAARLYVEFLTSKEGQTIISSFNRIPARSDVPSNPPRLTKGLTFFTLNREMAENYDEYDKLFYKTMGIRK